MADNTTLPGTGDIIADDDIGGVKFQRFKQIHGNDGVNDGDVSKTNPLPIMDTFTSVKFSQATIGLTSLNVVNPALANRRQVVIQNLGTGNVYVGNASSVAASGSNGGIQIQPGQNWAYSVGPGVSIYLIADQ